MTNPTRESLGEQATEPAAESPTLTLVTDSPSYEEIWDADQVYQKLSKFIGPEDGLVVLDVKIGEEEVDGEIEPVTRKLGVVAFDQEVEAPVDDTQFHVGVRDFLTEDGADVIRTSGQESDDTVATKRVRFFSLVDPIPTGVNGEKESIMPQILAIAGPDSLDRPTLEHYTEPSFEDDEHSADSLGLSSADPDTEIIELFEEYAEARAKYNKQEADKREDLAEAA